MQHNIEMIHIKNVVLFGDIVPIIFILKCCEFLMSESPVHTCPIFSYLILLL